MDDGSGSHRILPPPSTPQAAAALVKTAAEAILLCHSALSMGIDRTTRRVMPVTSDAAKIVLAASSPVCKARDKANAHVFLGNCNIMERTLFSQYQMHAEARVKLSKAIGHMDDAILERPNHPLQYELRAAYHIMAGFGSKSLNDSYTARDLLKEKVKENVAGKDIWGPFAELHIHSITGNIGRTLSGQSIVPAGGKKSARVELTAYVAAAFPPDGIPTPFSRMLSDRDLAHVTVAAYTLVHLEHEAGHLKKAAWYYATASRHDKAIAKTSPAVQKSTISNSPAKFLAQLTISRDEFASVNSSHSQDLKVCAGCGLAEKAHLAMGKPKFLLCSQCKAAAYCGTACQREHWKRRVGGHKKQCKAVAKRGKGDARAKAREKAKQAREKTASTSRLDAPPLDCALNPSAFWEEGRAILRANKNKNGKSAKSYEDAAFRFLAAMFMDWSFYCGPNIKYVAEAVDQVKKFTDASDPTAYPKWLMVLEGFSRIQKQKDKSIASCPDDFAQKAEAMDMLLLSEAVAKGKQVEAAEEEPSSIAEVDRFRFATGCAHVFASRNNYAAMHNRRANNVAECKAMEQRWGESCHLVNEATKYIPPHQSLTIMFELAFINRYAEAYKIADEWSQQLQKAGNKWNAKIGPYFQGILEKDEQGAAVARVQQQYGGLANIRTLSPMEQMKAVRAIQQAASTKKGGNGKKKKKKKKKQQQQQKKKKKGKAR